MRSSLAWPVILRLCHWPQAGSRDAVLPPPHAEQTQTTSASLLTWHPARPRHARGICSAHDGEYERQRLSCSGSLTFRHVWFIDAGIVAKVAKVPKLGIFMAEQENSLLSCGWINEKCQTLDGCDLVGNSIYLCYNWKVFLSSSSSDGEADVLCNGHTTSCTQPLLFFTSGINQSLSLWLCGSLLW